MQQRGLDHAGCMRRRTIGNQASLGSRLWAVVSRCNDLFRRTWKYSMEMEHTPLSASLCWRSWLS